MLIFTLNDNHTHSLSTKITTFKSIFGQNYIFTTPTNEHSFLFRFDDQSTYFSSKLVLALFIIFSVPSYGTKRSDNSLSSTTLTVTE